MDESKKNYKFLCMVQQTILKSELLLVIEQQSIYTSKKYS